MDVVVKTCSPIVKEREKILPDFSLKLDPHQNLMGPSGLRIVLTQRLSRDRAEKPTDQQTNTGENTTSPGKKSPVFTEWGDLAEAERL